MTQNSIIEAKEPWQNRIHFSTISEVLECAHKLIEDQNTMEMSALTEKENVQATYAV